MRIWKTVGVVGVLCRQLYLSHLKAASPPPEWIDQVLGLQPAPAADNQFYIVTMDWDWWTIIFHYTTTTWLGSGSKPAYL